MKYIISKEFHFSAAHVLDGLYSGHQCGRMHGHNYIVKFELSKDTLDTTGFVVDYGELKPIKEYIDNNLDHRFIANSHAQAAAYNLGTSEYFSLSDTQDKYQSSAENMAEFLYNMWVKEFPELVAVHISETPKTWATYSPSV